MNTIAKVKAYIGLGSNCGPRKRNINQALKEIEGIEELRIRQVSSLYLTKPWGKLNQNEFINQVIEVETCLSPCELLSRLNEIEIKMGRQRHEKWGPRNIDLDILLYGDQVIESDNLKVPHPYMRERLFVLVPLSEINAEIVFPEDGAKIREVLNRVLAREGNNVQKTN